MDQPVKNVSMRIVQPRMKGRIPQGQTALERLVDCYLEKIQQELSPDQACMVVAINMSSGEYTLGADSMEALEAYRKRWGDYGFFLCRVDGTPSGRM